MANFAELDCIGKSKAKSGFDQISDCEHTAKCTREEVSRGQQARALDGRLVQERLLYRPAGQSFDLRGEERY